jgi:hypothetical protein
MNQFDDTGQIKGSPKLLSNPAWQLVPAEPTEQMLDAMQTAGLAAFDADVFASLGDTPLDPTHARRAIWRAALDAAPEAPNAEPVAYMMANDADSAIGRTLCWTPQRKSWNKTWRTVPLYTTPSDHREALESSKASDAESIAMYRRCRDDRDKLREVMRQAIEALRDAHAYSVMHEEFRGGVLDVIEALRAALGERE